MTVELTLENLSNNSDWESRTQLSNKYTAVSAEDVLNKILNVK